MPQPMVKQLQYAAKYFATGNGQQTKAQPLARIATKNDMLRFSSKLPQVCFLGRSNVGKSSLLNALVGIPRLATVSPTPGCTKTINMYNIKQQLVLTDLPGFGHANVSFETYDNWLDVVKIYLKRAMIRRAFLLIDCRRGIQKIDLEVMDLFAKHNICYQIILTKIDELNATQVEVLRKTVHDQTAGKPLNFPEVLVSSSKLSYGIDMLRAHILEACSLTPT